MSNPYFNSSGVPAAQTRGLSSTVRTEFENVQSGFDGVSAALNTKAVRAGDTYTGTHDFTGGSIKAPTQSATDSSTNVATTAFVSAKAFEAALPAQTGNAGGTISTDGTNAAWVGVVQPINGTGVNMVQGGSYSLTNIASTNTVFPASPVEGGSSINVYISNGLSTNTFDLNGKTLIGPKGSLSGSGHTYDVNMAYEFRYVGGAWRI